jgi:hypothetical protein
MHTHSNFPQLPTVPGGEVLVNVFAHLGLELAPDEKNHWLQIVALWRK